MFGSGRGCARCDFVSETAQVELRSGRVQAPAHHLPAEQIPEVARVLVGDEQVGGFLRHLLDPRHVPGRGLVAPVEFESKV